MSYPFGPDAQAPTGPAAMNGSPARPNTNIKGQRTPSGAQQGQQKLRNRKKPNQNFVQGRPDYSGSMSDSVTNPQASKKTPAKQERQSVAMGAVPGQQSYGAYQNGQNQQSAQKNRPASMGGSMLPATPAKEQAYAGPTFQASPAASSLPMPKFFSKSVPNAASQGAQPSLAARMEGEKTPEQKVSPGPDYVSPNKAQHQSPLDMFFQADKAEKERKKSQGGGVLSPATAARAPPATEPRNPFAQNGRSVFLSELDGDRDDVPSPKVVGPRENRPTQSRAQSSPGQVPQVNNARNIEEEKDAMTRSLKAMLMTNAPPSPTTQTARTPPTQHPQHPQPTHPAYSLGQPFGTPSPPAASRPNPIGPSPSDPQSNHYALQYGNRNLSPLFRSSRTHSNNGSPSNLEAPTPSRPSSLRQEVNTTNTDPVPFPTLTNTNGGGSGMSLRASGQEGFTSPPQQQSQQKHQGMQQHGMQPSQSQHMDSNAFSRQFLDQSIRAPSAPYTAAASTNGNGNGNGNDSGGGKDVSAMEDSLRKMLKLNGTS